MNKVVLCIVMLSFLIGSSAVAQTITGTVTDGRGNPIPEVNIMIDGKYYNPTDQDGRFSVTMPDIDRKEITFSHVGFKSLMKKIEIGKHLDVSLERAVYETEGISVHASRAGSENRARAYTDFTSDDIDRDYLVGEFPLLLETTPNLYSYADAGGGLGYSYIRMRGFDDKRMSVYINGIPLNDPEDQATYFVDIPDFASEVTDIRIERGVGSSLYGDASFGGTVNIVSGGPDRPEKVSLSTGYGSYFEGSNAIGVIRKQAIEYSSGLVDGRWSFAGRYSKLWSDGYRKGSWYDGTSYFFSVSRLDPNMVSTMNVYGGPMRMHLAYYGVDRETLNSDRRYNPLEYDNETDNFDQPHYELHNIYRIDDDRTLSNTLYYIRGKGYYEQFKDDRDFAEYDIPGDEGDLVQQQWVIKNQYGFNPRLDIEHGSGQLSVGGAFYLFDSEHWGQVVWAEGVTSDLISPRHKYYEYFGDKFSGSVYAGENFEIDDSWSVSLNLQTRYVRQSLDQTVIGAFDKNNDYNLDWFFLSPRAGARYKLNDRITFSASAAISSRTPADVSIYDANDPDAVPTLDIKPERVYDFELGASYRNGYNEFGLNLYWMDFRNEIIPTGGIDDDGNKITTNADRSVHSGIEMLVRSQPTDYLSLDGNFSVTRDRIRDFKITQELYGDSDSWNYLGNTVIDFSGNPTPGFPTYLGNLLADFHYSRCRLVARSRIIGRQYIDNGGSRDLSIDPYVTFSTSASIEVANPAGLGKLVLTGRVDNLFNEKYETAGGAETYRFRDSQDITYAWYYAAAERSYFLQLKLEMD
jgi:iron complex outermembrane receptor protein